MGIKVSRSLARRALAMATLASLCVLSLSCGDAQLAVTETSAHQDPASIKIFWGNGEVTQHIPLTAGETARLEVRLYAANGARIVGFDSHFQISFSFSPTSLAVEGPVAGQPLLRDVLGPTRGAHGTVMVTVVHTDMNSTKTFGPFEMLLH